MQQSVLLITVILVVPIIAIFAYVAMNMSAVGEKDVIQSSTNRIRSKVIWLMSALGVPLIAIMIIDWPHAAFATEAKPILVEAESGQWYWELSQTSLPVQTPITFKLTSVDVNHGFALYNEDMMLVTQAQAMPGITNELHFEFETPGPYTIACLEYCGVAHPAMITEIEIVDRAQYDQK